MLQKHSSQDGAATQQQGEHTHYCNDHIKRHARIAISCEENRATQREKKKIFEELRGQHTKQEQCNIVKAREQHFNGRKPSKVMLP